MMNILMEDEVDVDRCPGVVEQVNITGLVLFKSGSFWLLFVTLFANTGVWLRWMSLRILTH